MTNAEPDAYIVNVLGKTRKDLVSANMKADGTLDAAVNTPITQNNLEEETDRLSRLVAEVSNCKAVITDCTPLIADARTKLSGDKMNSDDVLNDLDTVKRRLIQAYKSRSMWPRVFIKLLVYNFLIAAGLVVLIFLKSLVPDSGSTRSMAAGVLACAVWGCLGGIVDAFQALIEHFTDQNFDRQFQSWYFLHPLMGVSLGAVVYLIFQAGLASVGNSVATTGSATVQVGITSLSIVVAFLAGFKQTSAIAFVNGIGDSIFNSKGSASSTGTNSPTSAKKKA
ncbi:MAG: hypothetical protein ABR914_01240 [Dehalococcoidales bacterium]|jgi:hypothetical protein